MSYSSKAEIIIIIKTHILINYRADRPQSTNFIIIQNVTLCQHWGISEKTSQTQKYVWDKLTWHLSNRPADQTKSFSLSFTLLLTDRIRSMPFIVWISLQSSIFVQQTETKKLYVLHCAGIVCLTHNR